ncbi:hypothetical protein Bca4012_102679 [Brassica carinata]
MCKCRSHGTFPLRLQSSHLNICYYHQDLHRRRPPARASRFCSDRRASYSSRPGSCPDGRYRSRASAPSIFGLVDSAELASELQLSRGKLRGNQLLDGSISLSPLYPSQTNDLHARSPWPPPEFLWLRPPGIVHHLSVPTGMLTLNPSRKIKVGRLCTREGSSQSASLRHGFTSPADSHTCQTLGPCFKTGRMGSPQADARARRCRGTP